MLNSIFKLNSWIAALALVCCLTVHSLECVNINRIKSTISLDGRLDDPGWQEASKIKLEGVSTQETIVYIGYDDKRLLFGFKCFESQMDKLKTSEIERDGKLWTDDSVEIFLNPGNPKNSFYYHFMINSAAVKYDSVVKRSLKTNERKLLHDSKWNGEWDVSTYKDKDFWSVEVAIPYTTLELGGGKWWLNIAREEKPHDEMSSLSGSFHHPENFAFINGIDLASLSSNYPCIVKDIDFGKIGWGQNALSVKVCAKDNEKSAVAVEIEVLDDKGKSVYLVEKEIALPSNGEITQNIDYPLAEKGKTYEVLCRFYDASSKVFLSQSKKVEVSSNLLSVSLDNNLCAMSDEAVKALVVLDIGKKSLSQIMMLVNIRNTKKDMVVVTEKYNSLVNAERELNIPIANLPEGRYMVEFILQDKDNKFLDKAACEFEKVTSP